MKTYVSRVPWCLVKNIGETRQLYHQVREYQYSISIPSDIKFLRLNNSCLYPSSNNYTKINRSEQYKGNADPRATPRNILLLILTVLFRERSFCKMDNKTAQRALQLV